jgi:hypothetical protein
MLPYNCKAEETVCYAVIIIFKLIKYIVIIDIDRMFGSYQMYTMQKAIKIFCIAFVPTGVR